jgi:hypothetical protein
MKTATKIIFTSALTLSAVAPTFAHAAYLQAHAAYMQNASQVRTTSAPAQRAMDKSVRAVRGLDSMAYAGAAQTQVSRARSLGFYGTGNTSVPGVGVDKDDTTPKSK